MSSGDPSRVCRVAFPSLPASLWPSRRSGWLYLAGASFALGWWVFFDACITSASRVRNGFPGDGPSPVRISLVDWVPGLLGTLGLIWISALDKSLLKGGEGWDASERGLACARINLFLAFTMLACDLAGSVAVLVVKYLVPALGGYEGYGVANLGRAMGVMLATVLVWSATAVSDDTEYTLHI